MDKKSLGLKIKAARNLQTQKLGKRYTGKMLADDAGISRSYLGDIENGRTYPSYNTLHKIAQACNLPVSYFQDEDINGNTDNRMNESTLKYLIDHDITTTDTKGYENFMTEVKALFMNDEFGEDDIEKIYKDISDIFWETKAERKGKLNKNKGEK